MSYQMRLIFGALALVDGLALSASPAQAQRVPLAPLLQAQQGPWQQAQQQAQDRLRYPSELEHERYHDELEHREFHRDLEHREAHRYPMTYWEHERLHDELDHERFHDDLEHREFHRQYDYTPYRAPYSTPYRPSSGFGGSQGRGFSLYLGR
jgi:hypothetical protein